MDAVSTLLQRHRAQDAFLVRCLMTPPWCLLVADQARVSVVLAVRGCLVVERADTTVTLTAGDLAVIKGPQPYRLADRPGRTPAVVIEPGQVCRPLDADRAPGLLGPRTWGYGLDAPTAFLTVTYELPGQVTGQLLDALDELVVLSNAGDAVPAARLLADEFSAEAPGQDAVLDRLADVVLVGALRAWFVAQPATAPGWWRARTDPVVGPVLAAVHDRPGHPWTTESLASCAGVSRATLSRRFTAEVGEPPMTYLTRWRLRVAADLLATTSRTVESVALEVGYTSAFAFSTAFSRHYGRSPRAWRLAEAQAESVG